ncbi:MAG: hypothetical protein GY761_03835 [Hyphomicrobiales bacterium]|nr:hypothetical protein [Hyphomicrobiales bacterium]
MYFDVRAALLKIERGIPATSATPATQERKQPKKQPRVANVAEVAASQLKNQKSAEVIILDAVRAGNWSPGMIARASRLGTTKAYQEIEKLRSEGKIHQARDGVLTVAVPDGKNLTPPIERTDRTSPHS